MVLRDNAGSARPWPVVAVMVSAQMLIWLDSSILNVAVTTLADPVLGLGAGSGELEWIVSAYTLVFASTLFAGGALADRLGPRTTLLAGLVIFACAATAGAYAGTPAQLIAARGLMGAGSGLLMPSTLSIIVQSTPPALRTRAIAIWGSSSGLGVAIGPVTGGALLGHFWWGSVFLVNVPIVVLCVLGIVVVVPALRSPHRRVLDLPGLVLSILGFGGLVYGVIEFGRQTSWTSPRVLAPMLGGVALIVAFVVVQRRSTAPSMDLRLFTQRRFAAGSAVLLLAFMGLSGQLFFAAFYLQGPRGLSPQTAGTVMVAAAAGIILGSQLVPTATRWISGRWTTAVGILATGGTYASYLWFDQRTPLVSIAVMLFFQGFGMGLVGTPVTIAMMAGVPPHLVGAGSAVSSVARQVGSTLGVAVTGALLAAVYRSELTPALARLPAQYQEQARTSVEAARSLARSLNQPALAEAADRAFLSAMYTAAIFTSLLASVGFVVAVVGLYVRPRHRADRGVTAQRDRHAGHRARSAAVGRQPAAARSSRPAAQRVPLDAARIPAPPGRSWTDLRIGGVEGLLLPAIALAIRELLPGTGQTTTVAKSSDTVLELIRTGELDIAVVVEFPDAPLRNIDTFISFVLMTEPLFVGLSMHHPLARQESIHLRELAHAEWVAPPNHLDGLGVSLRSACERAGFTPRFRHFGASATMASELVRSGDAIAVFLVETPIPCGVVLKPLVGEPLWRQVRIVWSEDSPVAAVPADVLCGAMFRCAASPARTAVG